jgi:hypothetical protein
VDAVLRGRGLLLRSSPAFAVLLAGACASRPPMGPVGVSTGGALSNSAGAGAAEAKPPSPLPVDFRATLTKRNSLRFQSGGHAGGRFDADVYVTPSAKDVAFDPHGVTPVGTVLVMDQTEHGKSTRGPTLMMEKMAPGFDASQGDWRYVVVDGAAVEDGRLELCARCHDEAPHDHVFSTPQ